MEIGFGGGAGGGEGRKKAGYGVCFGEHLGTQGWAFSFLLLY